jgi:hypothetical protein
LVSIGDCGTQQEALRFLYKAFSCPIIAKCLVQSEVPLFTEKINEQYLKNTFLRFLYYKINGLSKHNTW